MTKVTVRPGEGYVDLVVEGALTAMLALGSGARAEAFSRCSKCTMKMVAGARNTLHWSSLASSVSTRTPGTRKTAMRQGLRFMRPAGSLSQPAQQRT